MKDRRKPCLDCGKLCWGRSQKCKDCVHRFGKVGKYSKDEIIEIIKDSTSKAQVLSKLDLAVKGGNYKVLDRFIALNQIDISHFLGQAIHKGKVFGPKRPIQDYIEKGFYIQSHKLKSRLIEEGIFEHMCYSCGRSRWESQIIPLELDHINGDHSDNSLSNIRLLCPNCHAQTSTYRGKNKKSNPRDSNPHETE